MRAGSQSYRCSGASWFRPVRKEKKSATLQSYFSRPGSSEPPHVCRLQPFRTHGCTPQTVRCKHCWQVSIPCLSLANHISSAIAHGRVRVPAHGNPKVAFSTPRQHGAPFFQIRAQEHLACKSHPALFRRCSCLCDCGRASFTRPAGALESSCTRRSAGLRFRMPICLP